jgi:hypothetical protein
MCHDYIGEVAMKDKTENFANEMRYTLSQINDIADEKIRRRTENTLMWYVNKAKRSRALFYAFSLISIAASAAIPVINTIGGGSGSSFSAKDTIISLVAAIGGVAVSVSTLFNLKEAWNRNRRYAERLKQECFFYQTRSENYSGKSDTEADKEFIQQMENLTLEENKSWAENNRKNGGQSS